MENFAQLATKVLSEVSTAFDHESRCPNLLEKEKIEQAIK